MIGVSDGTVHDDEFNYWITQMPSAGEYRSDREMILRDQLGVSKDRLDYLSPAESNPFIEESHNPRDTTGDIRINPEVLATMPEGNIEDLRGDYRPKFELTAAQKLGFERQPLTNDEHVYDAQAMATRRLAHKYGSRVPDESPSELSNKLK